MKRLVQAVFFLFCAAALGVAVYYLVRERTGAAAAARPVATRQVVVAAPGDTPEEREARVERESAVNHIEAMPNEVILDAATFNLDQDEGDEQVLTVRKTDRLGGRLSIVVADYLPQRKTWVRSWEGETLATKLTTFSIQVKDLIGDHNLNIVCTGMDDADEQTVTVFRRSPGSASLAYTAICSVAADAVAIEELDRTEGYQLGQTNGASWPVHAYSRDKESSNLLDQVRTTWNWDYRKNGYVASAEQRIPGAQVEREAVARVLTGSEKDFESFLQGMWHESAKGASDPKSRIIVFDRAGNLITFFSPESQEVFRWNDSHATRYGIYASCQNESVSNLRRLMDIEMTGAESISVRVFEDLQMKMDAEDRWDGSFRKLPESAAQAVSRGGAGRPAAPFRLEGTYRSADGTEIGFAPGRYSLRAQGKSERGGFGAYRLGRDLVVELTAMRDDGIAAGRKTYRATFTETAAKGETLRRLVLTPARATITGLELLEEPSLRLEQRTRP